MNAQGPLFSNGPAAIEFSAAGLNHLWFGITSIQPMKMLYHAGAGESISSGASPLSKLPVRFDVSFRLCRREDLPRLEWHGLFSEHREIIATAFKRQERGDNLMLLAEGHGEIAGQIWIDLAKKRHLHTAFFWALRVVPWLHCLGIGTRLIEGAEELARQRRFVFAELGVEIENRPARMLYERVGFRMVGKFREAFRYTRPTGGRVRVVTKGILMRKRLRDDRLLNVAREKNAGQTHQNAKVVGSRRRARPFARGFRRVNGPAIS